MHITLFEDRQEHMAVSLHMHVNVNAIVCMRTSLYTVATRGHTDRHTRRCPDRVIAIPGQPPLGGQVKIYSIQVYI